jgi:hypothetical protein
MPRSPSARESDLIGQLSLSAMAVNRMSLSLSLSVDATAATLQLRLAIGGVSPSSIRSPNRFLLLIA